MNITTTTKIAFSALLLLSAETVSFAGNGGTTPPPPPPPDKDILHPIGPGKPYKPNRPKAPGIFDVYAWTEGGTLTVQFVRPAGVCEMTVTTASDPVSQTYTFHSEAPFSTAVDTTDPELSLEIVTEEGATYIGEIPVE